MFGLTHLLNASKTFVAPFETNCELQGHFDIRTTKGLRDGNVKVAVTDYREQLIDSVIVRAQSGKKLLHVLCDVNTNNDYDDDDDDDDDVGCIGCCSSAAEARC